MKLNTKDISSLIKNRMSEYSYEPYEEEMGLVLESADGIARIGGLPHAMLDEMIEFPGKIFGIVLNLEMDEILVIILGKHTDVKEGAWAKCTSKIMQVPVGNQMLGRVINAIGEPIDGKGPIETNSFRPIEEKVPGIIERSPVNTPLQTGYKIIDSLIPIGRGQRELIVGDRKTGKTTLAIDTILNQKNTDVICIYVAIGQKSSSVVEVVNILEKHDALKYSIVIDASANDPASMQYIAPYAGSAIAEEFMYNQNKDVLIIYDDLTKHANAYRMISLLLQRSPGREAFPGDIFYLHSRLLERSAKLSKDLGGGSITALPIIETQKGDISTYIPTNVISITDGQIFLNADLFHAGFRPAINAGISVSRVGGKAQTQAIRKLSGKLRLELARYKEKESFAAFASELDIETQTQLKKGKILEEILKQNKHKPQTIGEQVISLFLSVNDLLLDLEIKDIKNAEQFILDAFNKNHPKLIQHINKTKELSSETEQELTKIITQLVAEYQKGKVCEV